MRNEITIHKRELYQDLRDADLHHDFYEKNSLAPYIILKEARTACIKGSEDILQLVEKINIRISMCHRHRHYVHRIGQCHEFGQYLIGISVLKGMPDLLKQFQAFFDDPQKIKLLLRVQYDYTLLELCEKKTRFNRFYDRMYAETGIPTDFVYTGKMFYAATDLINKKLFPGRQ